MPISEWIEKLGRVVFEAPFGSLDPASQVPELAEIRLKVLDQVKARSHTVAGRRVFPYNVVRIRVCGVAPEQQTVLRGEFFARYCEQELRAGLERSAYRFPGDLRVEVDSTEELPEAGGDWVVVEAESVAKPPVSAAVRKPARLTVVKGSANVPELLLSKARTNIGRSSEVYRSDGPSRRNDLAFDESGPINSTVSREHAHIVLDRESGVYRLFNDRWDNRNCGLWILRDGLTEPVRRDPRGVLLQPGDEIHLGRAVLKFK